MEKEIEKVEKVATEKVEKTERKPRKANEKRQPRQRQPKLYEEEVISIGRVTKVTKGGRHFRFSAVVVVGDRKARLINWISIFISRNYSWLSIHFNFCNFCFITIDI